MMTLHSSAWSAAVTDNSTDYGRIRDPASHRMEGDSHRSEVSVVSDLISACCVAQMLDEAVLDSAVGWG
jgi:hypothetical protein